MKRVGSTIYGDFWDGTKWVSIGTRVAKGGNAAVSLLTFNSTSRKAVSAQFSNFSIVSGETSYSRYYSDFDSIVLE